MARAGARVSWLGLTTLLVAACTPPLAAQSVEGRVVHASDSVGIAWALVRLLDASGAHVAQATTEAGGAFSLRARTAGPYSVAVLRIGQRPWRSAAITLELGAVRRLTVAVPDEPVTLEAIPVEARSRCRTSPAEGSLVVRLLEEADKALTLTRLAMERRDTGYVVELYQRMQTRSFETVDSIGMLQGGVTWPIRSVPPESLAVHGFVREVDPRGDSVLGRYTYYGPDATVLLSPWFLATHCFGVREGAGTDAGAVVVTFRPEAGRHADIEGRFVIERGTLELRRVDWRYVRQPWWVNLEGAAGEVELERLQSGVFLPSRWWMRVPMAGITGRRVATRVWGWKEGGGRIVRGP